MSDSRVNIADDERLTEGEKRVLDRFKLDFEMAARIDSYLMRREHSRRRLGGEVSEASFRAWLRRVLGLNVTKERWS